MASKSALLQIAEDTRAAEAANDAALASVIGPIAVSDIVAASRKKSFFRDSGLTSSSSRSDFLEAVMKKLVQPALTTAVDMSRQTVRDTRVAIIEAANKSTSASTKCDDAKKLFQARLLKIGQCNKAIDEVELGISKLKLQRDKIAKDIIKADGVISDEVNDKLRRYDVAEKMYATQKAREEQAIYEIFDDRLGGMRGQRSSDTTGLSLPEKWEDVTVREIVEPIRAYLVSKVSEFYMVLLYFDLITNYYDDVKGMFLEPASAQRGYDEVPEQVRDTYKMQNEKFYKKLTAVLGVARTTQVESLGFVGKHQDKKIKGFAGDGLMAVFCMLMKYGKNESHNVDAAVGVPPRPPPS